MVINLKYFGYKTINRKEEDFYCMDPQSEVYRDLCIKKIKLFPGDPLFSNNLGIFYAEKGMLNKAVWLFEKAIVLYKDSCNSHVPWFNLGVANYEFGDYHKSIKCYDIAIEIFAFSEVLHNRGVVYLLNRKNSLAIRDFKKAVDLGNLMESLEVLRQLNVFYLRQNDVSESAEMSDEISFMEFSEVFIKKRYKVSCYDKLVRMLRRETNPASFRKQLEQYIEIVHITKPIYRKYLFYIDDLFENVYGIITKLSIESTIRENYELLKGKEVNDRIIRNLLDNIEQYGGELYGKIARNLYRKYPDGCSSEEKVGI